MRFSPRMTYVESQRVHWPKLPIVSTKLEIEGRNGTKKGQEARARRRAEFVFRTANILKRDLYSLSTVSATRGQYVTIQQGVPLTTIA